MDVPEFCTELKNNLEFAGTVKVIEGRPILEVVQDNKGHRLSMYVTFGEIIDSIYPDLIIESLVKQFSSLHQFSN